MIFEIPKLKSIKESSIKQPDLIIKFSQKDIFLLPRKIEISTDEASKAAKIFAKIFKKLSREQD